MPTDEPESKHMPVDPSEWIVQSLDELVGQEIQVSFASTIEGEEDPLSFIYKDLKPYDCEGVIVPDILAVVNPRRNKTKPVAIPFVQSRKNRAIFLITVSGETLYKNDTAKERYAKGAPLPRNSNEILSHGKLYAPMPKLEESYP